MQLGLALDASRGLDNGLTPAPAAWTPALQAKAILVGAEAQARRAGRLLQRELNVLVAEESERPEEVLLGAALRDEGAVEVKEGLMDPGLQHESEAFAEHGGVTPEVFDEYTGAHCRRPSSGSPARRRSR